MHCLPILGYLTFECNEVQYHKFDKMSPLSENRKPLIVVRRACVTEVYPYVENPNFMYTMKTYLSAWICIHHMKIRHIGIELWKVYNWTLKYYDYYFPIVNASHCLKII